MMAEVQLVTEECANCHIIFAVTADFRARYKKSHENFSCPAGHSQYYPAKSNEEKLRDQLSSKNLEISILERKLRDATKPKPRGRPRKTK